MVSQYILVTVVTVVTVVRGDSLYESSRYILATLVTVVTGVTLDYTGFKLYLGYSGNGGNSDHRELYWFLDISGLFWLQW